MNHLQAQKIITELTTKAQTEALTTEDQAELTKAQTILQSYVDTAKAKMAGAPIAGVAGFLANPTVVLVGKVVGVLGIAALSAFGGMKYEQRRQRRGNSNNLLGYDSNGSTSHSTTGQHSDSPNSHPATDPMDGRHFNHRGNPGNEGNQTNHPSNRGSRNNAATTTA